MRQRTAVRVQVRRQHPNQAPQAAGSHPPPRRAPPSSSLPRVLRSSLQGGQASLRVRGACEPASAVRQRLLRGCFHFVNSACFHFVLAGSQSPYIAPGGALSSPLNLNPRSRWIDRSLFEHSQGFSALPNRTFRVRPGPEHSVPLSTSISGLDGSNSVLS